MNTFTVLAMDKIKEHLLLLDVKLTRCFCRAVRYSVITFILYLRSQWNSKGEKKQIFFVT